MPDKKISELVNLTALAADDEFVVVDAGANATKRITATNLSKFPSGVTIPDGSTIGSASDPDAMSIASGGVVTFSQGIALASGKGIDFSATADGSGTTTSELFDDYEEGAWTPTLPNGGTLTVYGAAYTKIGRMVLFSVYLQNIAPTNNSSQFRIGGLPFTPNNTAYSAVTIGYVGDANMDDWVALTDTNDAYIYFHVASGSGSARTNSQYISAASGSLDRLIMSGFYFTN